MVAVVGLDAALALWFLGAVAQLGHSCLVVKADFQDVELVS